MFSSIMVPEGVRRLFQVLTGEDMTDADEGGLFAVADALESGAVGVGEVGGFVAELVGKVRTEFSGKAADRFAGGLEVFDGLLASGEGALRELAVFVRDLARQVRYLKLVTIYGLELLLLEMAWAVAMAGATGGASMAWLAARMAVMRFLLSRWWGQLFMRLAMAAAGGVAFNVVPDLQAQLQMLGEKSSEKWDGKLSEQAAGMGAFSALVSLPLSALGGLVSNALTKVLVRGLGDEVDAAILEAAVRRAVAEHAELYPVSAMARFADVVGEHLDFYAGMSVWGMWSARFGEWVGEALENALSELFGEVGYLAATGQEVTWNPFSVTAGVFESVFSGVGNLAGLVWRGKLHPEGPSPYLEGTGRREGTTTDGGGFDEEKTPLLGIGSGSQTGDIPGSPGKDNTFDSSDSSKPSDVDSVLPVGPVDSAAVSVPSGKDPVVSAVVDGKDSKDVKGGKEGADGSVPGGKPARGVPEVPGSGQHRPGAPLPAHSDGVVGSGQDRPGTPPPAYSDEVVGSGPDQPGTPPPAYSDGVVGSGQDRPGTPPPAYRPVAGGDPVPGGHGVDVPGNRPLEVFTSQTPDSPAVTPHASGAPADTALPETGRSGSVVDSDSGVLAGQPTSPSGMTGRDGDPGVDSVAGHGDSHRTDVAAVSSDSAMLPVEGSQAAPYLHQDPAGLPAGLPADTVRVPVPADVVSRGGLAEFVRGGVADSTGGPVVLVAQGGSGAGVVVSPGQGSALARGLERNVVALTPGQGGVGLQWTVFAADGSARPVAGPGAPVPAGGRGGVAGLADASTAVPDSGQQAVVPEETPAVQTASVASAGGWGSGEPVTDASGRTHQNPDEEFRASRPADDRAETTGGETAERSGETERGTARESSPEPETTPADPASTATTETARKAREQSAASHRSSGLREFGDRSARSDEESLAGDSSEASSDSDVSESWPSSGDLGGSVSSVESSLEPSVESSVESSVADVRGEIDRAKEVGWSRDDEVAAGRIVWGTHDIAKLARGDAVVSREDVVALVAAKHHELAGYHQDQVVEFSQALADRLGTRGSGLAIRAGAGPEDQAGRSGESSAAAELSALIAKANAGLERMRRQGLPEETLPINGVMAEVQERMGALVGGDGLRNVVAHHMLSHPGDAESTKEFLREFYELVWDERYERAAAQVHEWDGIAGPDAVARLLVDADGILGPLKVSGRFGVVLAHWLGEHRRDWRGAQAVRVELADYLAGDPGIGMAVSGLTSGAFEEVRAEEERWQADRAGNQAEAAAPMVRGRVVDSGLSVIYQVSSVKRTFADAGRVLRQLADAQDQGAVARLYAAADDVLGPLKESRPFRDVMARQLMTNPRADQQVQELRWKLVRYLTGDLSGGADSSAADNLLSATVTPEPGNKYSEGTQMLLRRVAVGKALSGLPNNDAVNRVVRNAAYEDALRGGYTAAALGDRFNRSQNWVGRVLDDVKVQLISDLQAAVGSLRQILAEAEANTDLRNEYEAKIAEWSDLNGVHVKTIRRWVEEAAAAVRGEQFRNDPIRLVWDERYVRAAAQLDEWTGIAGRDAVARLLVDADGILGPLKVSGRFGVVLAHWLGEHSRDWHGAQAVRAELAGYLSGDPGIGMAVSGLTSDALEKAKTEEEDWQADRARNQAEAAAPMVRGVLWIRR
ncbi:WXG100-like domain-containing protein [Saccharopolyspora pogona]|uniref:WXG100-like domain-containing protein n=1 Tax=Saccharopolyspora pogona TaxID=333966 RepID=UPI0016852BE0|nr:hypothetical protein [Saccharopolyspora pogona]